MVPTRQACAMSHAPTITLNGKRFTGSAMEALATAQRDSDVVGYYQRTAGRAITLCNLAGERVGGINRHHVLHSSARMSCGRYWHSYRTPDVIGEYESYIQQCDEARAALVAASGVQAGSSDRLVTA